MFIYKCSLTILENTFFSSREINNFYQTEPLIGNYALAYALGFAKSPYHNKGEVRYYQDLSELNNKQIYITPAKFIGKVKFSMSQFNSISDSYWSRMDNNAVATDKSKGDKKADPANYPQIGFIKMLSIGNKAIFFVISDKEVEIPKYIRLGKFMSKAKISFEKVKFSLVENQDFVTKHLLNPLDIPKDKYSIKAFDTYSVNPVALIDNVYLKGNYYNLSDVNLPIDMKFGVDILKGI